MKTYAVVAALLCFLSGVVTAEESLSRAPNIVLNGAVHFSAPDGKEVMVSPGQYQVEQAGPSQLLLIPVEGKEEIVIQGEVLTHEQYELFSPMALIKHQKEELLHVNLLLPGGKRIEALGSTREQSLTLNVTKDPQRDVPPTGTIEAQEKSTELQDAPKLVYVPPSRGAPGGRIGAATRSPVPDHPTIMALVPNHMALTINEQPTLYWYLSKSTSKPIDFRIIEEPNVYPFFEIRMIPPIAGGIHPIRLADYGIRLSLEVPYHWYVSLIMAPPKGKITAGGSITRIVPPEILSGQLLRIGQSQKPQLYAQRGLWYDSLSAISNLIEAEPDRLSFRMQRRSLLQQIGLKEISEYDRSQGF